MQSGITTTPPQSNGEAGWNAATGAVFFCGSSVTRYIDSAGAFWLRFSMGVADAEPLPATGEVFF